MKRVGIIGSGQLGRMTVEAALRFDPFIAVLGPDPSDPAAVVASSYVRGALDDAKAIRELSARCDAIGYEIEHIDVDALAELEAAGAEVIPASRVLRIVQDKLAQKEALAAAGVPQAPFAPVRSGESPALAAPSVGGFPIVAKSRRGGYDGRGVAALDGPDAASDASRLPPGPLYVEKKVDFAKELAVIVARGRDGSSVAYPCVEMEFDPRANLCDTVVAPAAVTPDVALAAVDAATRAIDALLIAADGDSSKAGVFAVELFLTRDGRVLVNEIAPRPHNSGHFTIEACETSQFEQYYRALAGLPLGSATQVSPAMMINLVGDPGAYGAPEWVGLDAALAVPGVSLHLYGKREVRPFRKMGHLTAIGRTPEEARERALAAREAIKVLGRGTVGRA
jgi:5-(carboxyamino)imidazole ribonucleotide synthase